MNRRTCLVLFASVSVAFITQACGSPSSKPPIDLALDKPTLLYFFTENWGPWAQMNPIVNGIAEEYRGRVDVRQLNARSDGRAAFAFYRLPGHPAYVVLLSNGQVIWSDVGIKTREQITEQLSAALAKQWLALNSQHVQNNLTGTRQDGSYLICLKLLWLQQQFIDQAGAQQKAGAGSGKYGG